MLVMHDLGMSPNAIAQKMGRSHNTITKYLNGEICSDAEVTKMVEGIKKTELNDLYHLGAKGRQRLHELLDKGDTSMIPTIALVDRVFQQRRLLEGQSTQNIATLSRIIEAAQDSGDEALRARVVK